MTKDQLIGVCLLGLIVFYIYLETTDRVFEEPHSSLDLGFAGIGFPSYTATASMASGSTVSSFILGTSTLGSNAKLG